MTLKFLFEIRLKVTLVLNWTRNFLSLVCFYGLFHIVAAAKLETLLMKDGTLFIRIILFLFQNLKKKKERKKIQDSVPWSGRHMDSELLQNEPAVRTQLGISLHSSFFPFFLGRRPFISLSAVIAKHGSAELAHKLE